jgi:hypothetical protein
LLAAVWIKLLNLATGSKNLCGDCQIRFTLRDEMTLIPARAIWATGPFAAQPTARGAWGAREFRRGGAFATTAKRGASLLLRPVRRSSTLRPSLKLRPEEEMAGVRVYRSRLRSRVGCHAAQALMLPAGGQSRIPLASPGVPGRGKFGPPKAACTRGRVRMGVFL